MLWAARHSKVSNWWQYPLPERWKCTYGVSFCNNCQLCIEKIWICWQSRLVIKEKHNCKPKYLTNRQTYKKSSLSFDCIGNTLDNTIGFDFQSILNFVWLFYIKLSHTLWTHSHSCIMFRHVKISNVQTHVKISSHKTHLLIFFFTAVSHYNVFGL